MKTRPPEHVAEPRPAAMPPLDSFKIKGIDEARLLRWLLSESLRRLRAARVLETTRKIVYPEGTSILRDCERLARRLSQLTGQSQEAQADTAEIKNMLDTL